MKKYRITGELSAEKTYPNLLSFLEANKEEDVIIEINSCGGDVMGLEHVCSIIEQREKLTYAHIVGEACSAALWLVTACDYIIATPQSQIGCVGIIQYDPTLWGKDGFLVSQQTPEKLNDSTESIQEYIDSVAERFISYIEKRRGVVRGDWSDGRIFSSAEALTFGLVDSILTGEFVAINVTKKEKTLMAVAASNKGIKGSKPTAKKEEIILKEEKPKMKKKSKATSVIIDDTSLTDEQEGQEVTVELIKTEFPEIYDAIKQEILDEIKERNEDVDEVMAEANEGAKDDEEVKTAAAAARAGKISAFELSKKVLKANAKYFAQLKPKGVAGRIENVERPRILNSIAKARGGR